MAVLLLLLVYPIISLLFHYYYYYYYYCHVVKCPYLCTSEIAASYNGRTLFPRTQEFVTLAASVVCLVVSWTPP